MSRSILAVLVLALLLVGLGWWFKPGGPAPVAAPATPLLFGETGLGAFFSFSRPPPSGAGCPAGFTPCGGWCCSSTQQCTRTFLVFGELYCRNTSCPAGRQFCPADNAPACCSPEDSCGRYSIGTFEAAICVPPPPPGGCNRNSPGYCGTISGGTNVCCTSQQQCITPRGVPRCQPTSCPAGQTLCSGTITDKGKRLTLTICCAGSCFNDPNGAPNCNPTPPTSQPTSQPNY